MKYGILNGKFGKLELLIYFSNTNNTVDLTKLDHFKVNFGQNWVKFCRFSRNFSWIFRGPFFAKNFSPIHFSFFAKNDKLCNTNESWKRPLYQKCSEKMNPAHENVLSNNTPFGNCCTPKFVVVSYQVFLRNSNLL